MNWQFAHPYLLLIALVVPAMWLMNWRRNSLHHGIASSTPSRIRAAGSSLRTNSSWIPACLISLALCGMVIAIARPREVLDTQTSSKNTIAIELVIDRSGSMDERVIFDGYETNRLEAVKTVVERFVVGNDTNLSGRTGDLLGLIVFGTYADTLMPLTQSHDVLTQAIRKIELPVSQRERDTAIGDALMLAIARLKATEDAMIARAKDHEVELKSKAIVLLTDGENRTGTYSPREASELAAQWGVKIYIIGIRGGNGRRSIFGGNPRGDNDRKMEEVAEITGGQYWGVNQLDELELVYAKIDQLERSTIEITESTHYRELYAPFALAGIGSYALGIFLRLIFYRSAT